MNEEVAIGEITRLIVHNEEFALLEQTKTLFNPLKVLNVYESERMQLKTISWLLNPKENHRIGDVFLKMFINRVLSLNEENESVSELLQIKLQLSPYFDANVYVDWKTARKTKTVDMVIHSPSNHLVIVVLHKRVNENLHNHMLASLSSVKEHSEFANCAILPIYITETGEEPPHSKFCSLTFEDLLQLVERVIDNYEDELTDKVSLFLTQYKSLFREYVNPTKAQVKLCHSIYRDHREIIHWLLQQNNDFQSGLLQETIKATINNYGELLKFIVDIGKEDPYTLAMNTFLEDKGDISISASRLKNTEKWFYPITFIEYEKMQQAVSPNWHSPYPISYYFKKEKNQLKLKLEIGPFKEPSQRMDFVKHVNDNSSFTINVKAFRVESISTCIKMESIPFEEWEWSRAEIISTRMNQLYNYKFHDINKEILKLIESFDWSLQ